MDPKIRDEALSDDPTQIKGRFGDIEGFVGDVDELSRYVIGGSDLSNVLKHYVQALYVDTSTTPGVVEITNYRGNIEDIPVEVPISVFLSNALIEPIGGEKNVIVFKATEEGQTDVTYELRKRDIATGNYIPLDANDCSRYNIYTAYKSSQGFFVVGVFQENNSYESINNRLTSVEGKLTDTTVADGTVNFGTQNISAAKLTFTQLVQIGQLLNTLHNLTVGALTVNTTANFTGAVVTMPTPAESTQAANKEYVDTKVSSSLTAALGAKMLVGTATTPASDPAAAAAPIGTFYFRIKS